MDGEGGNFAKWPSCIPVLGQKLVALFDDNFASYREISIEPCSPEAAPVRHNVKLVAVKLVDFAAWCDLKSGAVSMAANNLESLHRLLLALVSCKECDDRRPIACEEVPFALFEIPLLSLPNLCEAILSEQTLTVVDCVEMAWGCIETNKNFSGVFP